MGELGELAPLSSHLVHTVIAPHQRGHMGINKDVPAGVETGDWFTNEEFGLRKDSEDAAFLAHQLEHGNADDYEEDFAASMSAYPHLGGAVFAFDTARLSASHRIRAVNYDGDWDMEEEWRVITKTAIPVASILQAIYVKPTVIAWWMTNQPDRKAALQKLLSHPLRAGPSL